MACRADAQHGHQLAVDPGGFRRAGVSFDEDGRTRGHEDGPGEGAHVGDAQAGGDDLDQHEGGDDGDDEPDAPPVRKGAREDVRGLVLQGDEEPGQGVDEDADPAAEGEQYEADPHERDVDARRAGDASTHPPEHPRLGAAAQWHPVVAPWPAAVASPLAPRIRSPVGLAVGGPGWIRGPQLQRRCRCRGHARAGIGAIGDTRASRTR